MKNSTSLNDTVPEVLDFGRPFYLNLTLFIFGTVVALINGGLLFRMQSTRNVLKAKRYAFLANMTFCDLFSGLMMIGLAIANVIGGDGPLVCLLQGETCLNLCLTMCSYTCSILVQFIAVRYPIYYKTNITRSKIIMIVVFCWVYAIGFSGIKLAYVMAVTHQSSEAETFHIFPCIDVFLKLTYLIGNFVCFGYVLAIALIRRRQQEIIMKKKNQICVEDENKNEKEMDEMRKISESVPLRSSGAKLIIRHYEAIITSGIRLLVYLITCLPLTVFCAYVLATNNVNAMNPGKVYGDSRDIGVSLVLLWFCRALVDPLITLIREKPLLKRKTSSSISNYSRSGATSENNNSRYGYTNSVGQQGDSAM